MVLHTLTDQIRPLGEGVAWKDLLQLEGMGEIEAVFIGVVDNQADGQFVKPFGELLAHVACEVIQLPHAFWIAHYIGVSVLC